MLGRKWSLIHWDECAIELAWVVVEEGNTYRLRKLTKDGDDNAIIYVDQALMNILKWQKERQDAERERLGDLWVDHDLVFARDGFKLYRGEAGGPQDPGKVSARWRTARNRLHLPENFRLHDWRALKITNDLDNHENPVEVSTNARHHSPGYTMARYGSAALRERRSWLLRAPAVSACHPWSDQEVRSAVGHATVGETEKPQVNWGLCWCPRGDLNPHALNGH